MQEGPLRFVGTSPQARRFEFVAGREDEAVAWLLDEVRAGAELTLCSDVDEEGEGATCFRVNGDGFEARDGGHGWQGEWRTLTPEEATRLVRSLCVLNCGGIGFAEGQLTQR
ncbi:MAG: hypothetical protein H6721_26410 [Sandaracinus sp.]|nr:hypothetical protein [Myxococcales bacterium]MCB9622693.1 hypothetical protein [Sandaracinus sp.]MCB9635667.1 hypothetical protein [Sandaracinus sp.]